MVRDVSQIVEKFLSSLEKKVLDYQLQIKNLQLENKEYYDIEKIINKIHKSKIEFSAEISNNRSKKIIKVLEKIIKDKDKLNYYLSYIKDYYSLSEKDKDNQLKTAEQAIVDLENELKNYQSKIKIKKNRKTIETLKELEEKIIRFGTKFAYIEENVVIENMDLFVELIEDSRLAEEEKIILMNLVEKNNTEPTKKKLQDNDNKQESTLENDQFEELDDLEELTLIENIVAIIDENAFETLKELVNDPNIVIKLINKIKSFAKENIKFSSLITGKEKKELNEEKSSSDEQLNIFIEENDRELNMAQALYQEIFKGAQIKLKVTDIDEYLELIQKGREFYDTNKNSLNHMTQIEKTTVKNFSRRLYGKKSNRIIVYKSKYFKGHSEDVIKEATYEIEELLEIYDLFELNNKIDNEKTIEIGKRIGEILEAKNVIDENAENTDVKQGIIYFLENNKPKPSSIYEEEINNNKNKHDCYKELLFQLEQIENRFKLQFPLISTNNKKTFPYSDKFGLRFISNNKITTYFIPVGKKDAIIVGVSFFKPNNNSRKEIENRLKIHSERIEKLMEKIKFEEDKEESIKKLNKIKTILSENKERLSNEYSIFMIPKIDIIPVNN